MPSDPLRNLVAARKLKVEPPDRREFDKLMTAGRARLADAQRQELTWESRFDLAYGAAHAFALAALRRLGYPFGQSLSLVPVPCAHPRSRSWRLAGARARPRAPQPHGVFRRI